MDPFSLSTGGGGLSGGSSEASGALTANQTFGGFGTSTYNFGSGSAGGMDWRVIAGLAVVALIAFRYLKK